MKNLYDKKFPTPEPVINKNGNYISEIKGKKAAIVSFPLPRTYGSSRNRFARYGVENETLYCPGPLASPHDERKVAHPKAGITHNVLLVSKFRIVTGQQEVGSGFQSLGSGNLFHSLLEILRRRQIHGPFLDRLPLQPLALATMINVFGMTLRFYQTIHPIEGNNPKVGLREVAVSQFNVG